MIVAIFVLTLFILVVIHEYGHFFAAKLCGVKVLKFSFGFGKSLFSYTSRTGTLFSFNMIPLGGYVQLLSFNTPNIRPHETQRTFESKPAYQKMLIILAGPGFNLIFTWLVLSTILMIGLPTFTGYIPPNIEKVLPDSPAAKAGLQPKDVIKKINYVTIDNWLTLTNYIKNNHHTPLVLEIERNNKTLYIAVNPARQNNQGYLGIVSPKPICKDACVKIISYNPIDALYHGGQDTLDMIIKTGQFLLTLVTGKTHITELTGPIGIAQHAEISLQQGWLDYLYFLALVSLSLGMINLLPIPLLDGGSFVVICLEMIYQKPLPQDLQARISLIGFLLIGCLMMAVMYNDITKWL